MSSEPIESSGVQQLIDRLHEEGVEKGRSEASDLIASAREQAAKILDQAQRDADQLMATATDEVARMKSGAEAAIQVAGRDAILLLTEELRADFVKKLHKLVGNVLTDSEFLKQLLANIVRHSTPSDSQSRKNVQVFSDSLEMQFSEADLDQFVRSLGGEALREGLTFEVKSSDVPGVRIQAFDDDLEIDLTVETLTHLLLQRLSPRFRAILEPQSIAETSQ